MTKPARKNPATGILIYVILFITGGAIFLTRSVIPVDWDACQFVLGMERFSPVDHQPHPPGYLFLLILAKLIQWMTGCDDHTALLVTSALGSALLIPAIYALASRFFPNRSDIPMAAALLALAAPARLFFGAQALSYTWEGLFATLLIMIAMRLDPRSDKKNSGPWLLWLSVFAIAGGFRPNLLLFFIPLGLYLAIKRRWWENLAGLVLSGFITCSWLIPTLKASGGLAIYINAVRGQAAYFLAPDHTIQRLVDNLTALMNTPSAISGLHVIGWIVIFIIGWSLVNRSKYTGWFTGHNRAVVLIVFLPLLIFNIFIYYSIRYSLIYSPALIPIMAWFCSQLVEKITIGIGNKPIKIAWLLPALLLIISYHSFLTSNGIHSLSHIRSIEREIRYVSEFVRNLPDGEDVTLVAGRQFRRWGIELNEYNNYVPMHSLFSADINPRLGSMRNMNTTRGDFYLPDAPESESIELDITPGNSGQIIILDEDAYAVLIEPADGWNSERITNMKNIYWRFFNTDILFTDRNYGITFTPIE